MICLYTNFMQKLSRSVRSGFRNLGKFLRYRGKVKDMSKKILYLLTAVVFFVAVFAFSGLVCSASGEISAPGGEVHSYEELIAALGGEEAVIDKEDYLLLCSDIRLESPVVFLDGEYLLAGGGCRVTASFHDDSFFILGDGEKAALLKIGSDDAQTDNDSIIFDGEGKTLEGSFVRVNAESDFEIYIGTVFKDVISSVCGAAVYNEGTFTMYSGKAENCRSTGSGGAFFNKGQMFLTGGSVTGCSSEFGGAVYSEGKLELIGTEFVSCSAGKGGAVFNSGSLNYRSSSSSGCSAAFGAGIYNSGNAEFSGGQIIECTASDRGGALYNSGNVVLCGTYMDSNTAVSGGSVFNTAQAELSDGQVYNGTAEGNGGNFYNDSDASLTISGGTVGRGKATYGGGIFNLGELTVSGGGFSSNKADAGNAILNDGKLIFTEHPYIDVKNDVFIVIDGNNSHAAVISSEMKADTIAMLTPGVKDEAGYRTEYAGGAVLIIGEYAASGYSKFKVTSEGDNEWLLAADGTFYKKLPVYYEPWFYAALVAAFAVTVTVIVIAVRTYDKHVKMRNH